MIGQDKKRKADTQMGIGFSFKKSIIK